MSVIDQDIDEKSARMISRYADMPLEQVDKELRDKEIDPAPTIAKVKKLVQAKLAARRK